MKKVFATLALLSVMSVMTVMTFTPKTAQAADEGPCYWVMYCGTPALTCDWVDFVNWYEIFCGAHTE